MADDGSESATDYRISSFSGGGNCVKVGFTAAGEVTVRHSSGAGPEVVFSPGEWDAFIAGVKHDEFERPSL